MTILTITSQTLQAFGHRVLTVTNGADAMAVYAQHESYTAETLLRDGDIHLPEVSIYPP